MFDVIAFDADDTLWENESLYRATQARFAQLLAPYLDGVDVPARLYATETRNIPYFGYGIKSFTFSMIETALELTAGRITSDDVHKIITFAKEMIDTPTKVLDGVEAVVTQLSASHTLMLITKGDLLDQQRKLARSGLAHCFTHVEVVSEKTAETYTSLLVKYGMDIRRFLMVGNSLKSDVLPVVALGGCAIHIPYHITWAHEEVDEHEVHPPYYELAHIGQLPVLLVDLGEALVGARKP